MNQILELMLLVGAILLVLSWPATLKIYRKDPLPGWRALLSLIPCLLLGYALFFLLLLNHQYTLLYLIVTLILLAGAALVYLVIRLSLRSITNAQAIACSEAHNALHDTLTGLPNRCFLEQQLKHHLHLAAQQGSTLAVLMLDLDRFKEINDTLGHAMGDLVLIKIAQRFKKCLPKGKILTRLGGDEFALLSPVSNERQAIALSDLLHHALKPVIQVDDFPLTVDMSVGIALFPKDGVDRHTLLKHADVAMYRAKSNKLPWMVYDVAMDRHSARHLKLMPLLKVALEQGAFELHYQPVIDVSSQQVYALEALVRWPNAEGESVSPEEFIPMAEKSNCIKEITRWVLKESIMQAKSWSDRYPLIAVHVNLSALDIQDISFPEVVREWLEYYALEPALLVFEITERAMMQDIEQVRLVLNKLRSMGVGIAMDDYGTGFSSLTLLRELLTGDIKVDRSFIMGMMCDENHTSIVQASIDMAHSIGCKVIAEGVDSEPARQALLAMGCDRLQGYLISQPLNLVAINQWLDDHHRNLDPRASLTAS